MSDLFILIGILVVVIIFLVYRYMRQKQVITTLTQKQFREGYRKAQLIDVREPKEFDGGHILGARNIPMTQLKQRLNEIRKDQPVYFYCQSGARSARAALVLHKQGYDKDKLYQLQGGFKKWTGKIKKPKKLD
ncbi:rhodanese domain-containing protein [Gracilibacillus halophilus YIM-C55.5]|uniref:Rhodanese domain-containing protein n=1 Tax=Gracilibacillus halophilus YIM-C55.5 TaxID=1308866 RepID=N4WSW2_9BACI|nr:rhodanese-like domain-containing protein [Gracilibacillus halophilus]ENH97450.1 rhodanese domain-containing protein [Gracilibacillus halophilus YIM-C55.5]